MSAADTIIALGMSKLTGDAPMNMRAFVLGRTPARYVSTTRGPCAW